MNAKEEIIAALQAVKEAADEAGVDLSPRSLMDARREDLNKIAWQSVFYMQAFEVIVKHMPPMTPDTAGPTLGAVLKVMPREDADAITASLMNAGLLPREDGS